MQDPTATSVPMEDDRLHTDTSPFCYDPSCFCHEEGLFINRVSQAVNEGLLTPDEATAFVAGHSLWAGEEATQ